MYIKALHLFFHLSTVHCLQYYAAKMMTHCTHFVWRNFNELLAFEHYTLTSLMAVGFHRNKMLCFVLKY